MFWLYWLPVMHGYQQQRLQNSKKHVIINI